MSNPIFEDDPYYDDPKFRTPYRIGQDAFWDGSKCPYDNETKEQYEWAKGWRSEDIRQQCKDDYINGEQ